MHNGIRTTSILLVLLATTSLVGQDPCLPRRCNPGTLFRWSGALNERGGPDLNAPLVTDRPDFTEASSTVGLGVGQLEFGYTFVSDDSAGTTTQTHSWGEFLLRYGVWRDWLEVRLALLPLTQSETSVARNQTTSGLEDMYIGLKIGLTPQAGWRPEMALVPQALLPTGSSSFTRDEILPGLNWIYSWDVGESVSLAGSTQFNRRVEDSGESFTRWAQSCAVGYSVTDIWGSYAEWFARLPHGASEAKPEHYLNGGFTYLLSNDLQWDIRVGMGLNDAAPDIFCGSGFSWRFR